MFRARPISTYVGKSFPWKRTLVSNSSVPVASDGAVRINLWSSPRCASTSLMCVYVCVVTSMVNLARRSNIRHVHTHNYTHRYAFAQRSDTTVYDEPLYAHYLVNINPAALRPYRDEVIKAQNSDGNAVVNDLICAPSQSELSHVSSREREEGLSRWQSMCECQCVRDSERANLSVSVQVKCTAARMQICAHAHIHKHTRSQIQIQTHAHTHQ